MHSKFSYKPLFFVCLIGTIFFTNNVLALMNSTPIIMPTPPDIDAKAYLLIDYDSEQALSEKDAHKRIDPASLTKMMTMYVIDRELSLGKIKLDDKVLISEKAWRTEGSRSFVEVNSQVKVEDLVKGIIVQSGNDASTAMAEHVAGSEEAFTELMNYYAKIIGMKDTHFANATGLPNSETYTTAYDLAKLSKSIIRDYPQSYHLYSQKWFSFNGIKQNNRNKLLWKDPSVDGIKTGVTDSAGYCLAASAKRDNMRLIAVVMGTKSENERANQTHRLLSYGFRFFETHKVYDANTSLTNARVWMGKNREVPLGLKEDLYVTIPQGQYSNIDASMTIKSHVTAPILGDAKLGKLSVKLGDKPLLERELYALNKVEEGGFFAKLTDYVKLKFESEES